MAISSDDRRFLLRCEGVKDRSYDPDRKVGVLIVDSAGSVLAEGVNAPPDRLQLTAESAKAAISLDPSWKYFMFEHAERNAIFSARDRRVSIVGATMYGTLYPCSDCARAIVAAGISRLVLSAADEDPVRDAKWLEHYKFSQKIFELGGVTVEVVRSVPSSSK